MKKVKKYSKKTKECMKTISKENHKLWGYPLDYAHTTMVDGVLTSWYLKDDKITILPKPLEKQLTYGISYKNSQKYKKYNLTKEGRKYYA